MYPALAPLLLDQAGVVSRDQLLLDGLAPHDVRRLVRRRDLSPLHPGVYVDHTGEPTWLQLAWGAVLACWPAALTHQSALRSANGPGGRHPELPLQVVVAHGRRLTAPRGVVVRRSRRLDDVVQWNLGPPRVRYDEAVLDVAADAPTDLAAIDELARGVQGRRTTARHLQETLAARPRTSRRVFFETLLGDVATGACSVLEHAYLDRVERAHGLSPARRQVRDRLGAGVVYRDVEYAGGLVVELDGRLFHDTVTQRDHDLDRDLDTALTGRRTVRLSYGQVFDRPCWTAARLAVLLGDAPTGCGARDCVL